MARRKTDNPIFPAIVLVLAWIVPGAGHVYIGRAARGLIIFVTVTATFWAGIAMGGIMTVDSRTERWWFAADLCTGVNGLVSWYRSKRVYAEVDRELKSGPYAEQFYEDAPNAVGEESRRYYLSSAHRAEVVSDLRQRYVDKILSDKGYRLAAPAETVARAYSGVAGLLNALCIFDAVVLVLMGRGAEPGSTTPQRRKDDREGSDA